MAYPRLPGPIGYTTANSTPRIIGEKPLSTSTKNSLFPATWLQHIRPLGIAPPTQPPSVTQDSPEEILLTYPKVRALLDVIAYSEGADYDTMVHGNGSIPITDFSKHPNTIVTISSTLKSTAAGRYQFLNGTWIGLNMKDFTPHSQDLAAIKLFKRRKMIKPLLEGNFQEAIQNGNKEWASLPGSPYGQPRHALKELQQVYDRQLSLYESQYPFQTVGK